MVKRLSYPCFYQGLLVLALIFAGLLSNGCRSLPVIGSAELRVEPFAASDRADLTASQVVEIGVRAGLERDQILRWGTNIRNALASHGACRIYQNQRVRVIMAVNEQRLYVSLHTGATFIYDLREGQAVEVESSPATE